MAYINTNFLNSEAERLRFGISMLPTTLLMHISDEAKILIKELGNLPKKPLKQKLKFANIFNDLTTTQHANNFSFTDFSFVAGEMPNDSYQTLLRSLGAESFIKLYEHAKLVDDCIKKPFDETLFIEIKNYLETTFNYYDNDIEASMSAEVFYLYLVFSFIAHLDACIHFSSHSELIKPISFGWLLMHKLDSEKWIYDSQKDKYISIKKSRNPFTIPSRSFIELLQTIGYWHTRKEMPKSTYGIDNKIDWKTDDPDGKLDDFIKRKKEGKWISLEDVYWLFGFLKLSNDEPNETVVNWQISFNNYIKTEDITQLGGLPPNIEGMIWFVYAFFQFQYFELEKRNKLNNKKIFVMYPEYYDIWQCMTNYYESYIDESSRDKRLEWSAYIKKQATPIMGMT